MREQKDRYEIFLKVCETGSFSKAAEALNYTQSGISQMMATLEEELEVQLFARVNRGVTLTDNGTRLLPYIREMANQKARLRQAAFNINHKVEGKLRVSSFSSITTLWMPQIIHYFKENYPKVDVEILDGNYDEIRDWIIHGQVDCGFLSSIVADDLKFYPLWDDPLCAVFPENHPLAAQQSVTLPRRGVPLLGACLLPDAGAGVFQNSKLGGEPDIAEVSTRAEGIKIPGTLGCPVFLYAVPPVRHRGYSF